MNIMDFLNHHCLLQSIFLWFLIRRSYGGDVGSEIQTLMAMKAVLDPQSRILSSWSSDGDPCSGSFLGVACNEQGRVANISLQGKGLSGSIPDRVSGLESLTGLYLHYNALTGEIPKQISALSQLTDLYLNVNDLSGDIPPELGSMPNLQALQLCCNQLEGGIPKELGLLRKLTVLALQNNILKGAIPATLGDLTLLTRLDLSSNQLFGSVPVKLASLSQLSVLDVHNNSLSGTIPSDFKRLKEGFRYENNKDLCGMGYESLRVCTSSEQPLRPEPYGSDPHKIPESANVGEQPNGCSEGRGCLQNGSPAASKASKAAVFAGFVVLSAVSLMCSVFLFSWYRRRKQKIGSAFEPTDSRLSGEAMTVKDFSRKSASPLISLEYSHGWDPLRPEDAGCGSSCSGSTAGFRSPDLLHGLRFNLEEVESATQYFSEMNLLGRSNFSAVYRGILRDGSFVALRSINKTSCKAEEDDFLRGLKTVASLRHENLVKLRGFCCSRGRGECFLLYDFVPNGSLLDYLDLKGNDGRKTLEWSTRVWIISGIAKGVEYLHGNVNKPPLVHQNISAGKVLLDQHFNPLISGSGLHKLLADDVVFSTLKASAAMGYLAPEYMTVGRFTEESDVYAFGVLVLQILSGKRRVSLTMRQAAEAGNLAEFIDANLEGHYSITEAMNLVRVALCCTTEVPNHRPAMATVVKELSNRSAS